MSTKLSRNPTAELWDALSDIIEAPESQLLSEHREAAREALAGIAREQAYALRYCDTCGAKLDHADDEAPHCHACEDSKALDAIASILDHQDPANVTPADIERIGDILRSTCRTVRDPLDELPPGTIVDDPPRAWCETCEHNHEDGDHRC